MRLPAVILLCAAVAYANGHEAPAPGASEKRFKIVANGKEDVFRIDTATGRTWRLEAVATDIRGWVPVVETVKDIKSGGYKPAVEDGTAGEPKPVETR